MKKSKLLITASLATLLGIGLASPVQADSFWKAKTPDEIGSLNHNGTYTVREGDTIWAIGMHFNVKPTVIESINGINDPYTLQIGTILKINVKDHGDKAVLSVNDGQQKTEATLNNSDKIDQHKAFGEKVTPHEASEADVQNESHSNSENTSQTNESNVNTGNTQNNSTNTSSQSNLPSNVINMLAYVKAYGGPDNVSAKDLIINGNVIGQGTSDSTGSVAISGNNVSITVNGKTNTYDINDLANEYYNSSDQQQNINQLINQGTQNNNN